MSELSEISLKLSGELLERIGAAAIVLIRQRTLSGTGYDNQPLRAYSTHPFKMPSGGISQKARAMLGDQLHYFTTKRGTLWAVIEGGYAAFKEAAYNYSGHTDIWATGKTLGSLTVKHVDPAAGTITIGFSTAEAARIMYYLDQVPRGSKQPFKVMGLTGEELSVLGKMAAEGAKVVV